MTDFLKTPRKRRSYAELFGDAPPPPAPEPTGEAARWLRILKEKESLVRTARGLSPAAAAAEAYDHVLVLYLNETHPNTDSNACAWCHQAETPNATLLPYGSGSRHAWLHQRCRDPWAAARRKAAVEALAALGITKEARE